MNLTLLNNYEDCMIKSINDICKLLNDYDTNSFDSVKIDILSLINLDCRDVRKAFFETGNQDLQELAKRYEYILRRIKRAATESKISDLDYFNEMLEKCSTKFESKYDIVIKNGVSTMREKIYSQIKEIDDFLAEIKEFMNDSQPKEGKSFYISED